MIMHTPLISGRVDSIDGFFIKYIFLDSPAEGSQ